MKLVSLNTWGGKAYEPLMKFIKTSAETTDIFRFQEVFMSLDGSVESRGTRVDILNRLTEALPGFTLFFAPAAGGVDNTGPVNLEVEEGQATFLKNDSVPKIASEGSVFLSRDDGKKKLKSHETRQDVPSNFQYVRFSVGNKNFTVCNLHGIPYPGHKLDTAERLEQSRRVVNLFKEDEGAKILCGDFNLLPETESIKMIEDAGMVNLINKFGIERTRSRIHLSLYDGKSNLQKFADYTFVSPDVKVISFSVPDLNVSDHLPMVLEFE